MDRALSVLGDTAIARLGGKRESAAGNNCPWGWAFAAFFKTWAPTNNSYFVRPSALRGLAINQSKCRKTMYTRLYRASHAEGLSLTGACDRAAIPDSRHPESVPRHGEIHRLT